MKRTRPLIAVLDDEPKMCKAFSRLLKTHDFEVVSFFFAEDLLTACVSQLPDCLLLDLHMPGMSGLEVLERFAAQHTPVPVIVVTGHDKPGNAERIQALGAVDYLLKPVKDQTLVDSIKSVLNREPSGNNPPRQ